MFFFFCIIILHDAFLFFFSSRRRHTRSLRDWSSDVCSSDLLPKGNVLTVSYVGQHNTHLMVPMPYLQKQIVNGQVVPGPYLAGNPALLKQITQVSGTASDGNQKYNALQAHVRKRFAMGLEYQLGYTFSKGMTDAQGYYGSPGQAAGTGPYTQDIYNRRAEWAPTFFDNRH